MRAVRVTPRAAQDLEGIARWTLERWGADQMAAYLRGLNDRFDWLAAHPEAGRERGDIGKGYRAFPQGRHLVFYVVLPDAIAVIGVPHQAMDAGSHLG